MLPSPPHSSPAFECPPALFNAEGEERGVGIELEFTSLGLPTTAAIIARLFGGRVRREHHFEFTVEGTHFGDFTVEFDARPLKNQRYLEVLRMVGIEPGSDLVGWIEEAIEATASVLVPCEIVTPPIPVRRVAQLDRLVDALRDAHAEGTKGSPFYAFGLHLNPEVPEMSADSLLAHLRAFLLLADAIVEEEGVDLARQLTPYIKPFPRAYLRRVLRPDYSPDLDGLIGDYMRDNPTRNRPLDMQPVFAHLRPELVEGICEEPELLTARPTFHYRLPDSRVGVERWSIAEAWNGWVEVERLAADEERLMAMCEEATEAM